MNGIQLGEGLDNQETTSSRVHWLGYRDGIGCEFQRIGPDQSKSKHDDDDDDDDDDGRRGQMKRSVEPMPTTGWGVGWGEEAAKKK